jgi:hypothetical protein
MERLESLSFLIGASSLNVPQATREMPKQGDLIERDLIDRSLFKD